MAMMATAMSSAPMMYRIREVRSAGMSMKVVPRVPMRLPTVESA